LGLFKRLSVGRLLFGSFLIFITLLLLIFTWVSYSLTSKEITNTTSKYQQDVLNELNKQLDIQLNAIEQISLSVALNMDRIGFDHKDLDPYDRLRRKRDLEKMLSNISYSTTMIQSINFYMEKPFITSFQDPVQFVELEKLNKEEWFSDIQNNDYAWISTHSIHTNNGTSRVVSFARKLYSNSGKYYGLLLLNIKASDIESMLHGETKNRSRMLIDISGKIVSMIGSPILTESMKERISDSISQKKTDNLTLINEKEALLVWSKLDSDWVLVEVTPWKEITHASVRLAKIFIALGFSAIVIVSIFTLFLSRQFTKPILLLVGILERLPSKLLIDDIPTDYKNEFGYLFNGYRKQMEKIDELMVSLNEQHQRQREAEIKALQAMINPHFLYNTLDLVNWMAIKSGEHKISKILSLMGKMFRVGLSNGETMISIVDEKTHIECYLQIQKIRLQDHLTYTITVEDNMRNLYIPRVTLQPFIENAIIHGFHDRRKGDIQIKGYVENDKMVFSISDNGVGLKESWNEKKAMKTGGYGIRNVVERIEAYFGTPFGVEIFSIHNEGTTVMIKLPIIKHQKVMKERLNVEGSHN
jgi:two-component system sensor histidine kinase YesM